MIQEKIMSYIWAEVYDCINILGEEFIERIPADVYKSIDENRSLDYVSKYNEEEGITVDTFSEDAINIVAAIDLEYWSTEESKKEKEDIYIKNSQRKDEEAREKYSVDNIFKNENSSNNVNTSNLADEIRKQQEESKKSENNISIVSNNIFTKIKNYISSFIKKITNKGE